MKERRLGVVRGVVQGVGFRPFVARLAHEEALGGCVLNAGGEVRVDVEGEAAALERFARRLAEEAPAAARIDDVSWRSAPPSGQSGFTIEQSAADTPNAMPLPPDLATCEACLAEVRDPSARRFGYPFTNCTACGPRFTITKALPYDRPQTTMATFAMCAACRGEYEDQSDRRYHAQPIACATCGPELRLEGRDGAVLARSADALGRAAEALRRGEVLALKGLGGYQLLCDATNPDAVTKLRARKRRADEPFAVMTSTTEGARAFAHVDAVEEAALESPAGPIVLVRRRASSLLAPGVAPRLGRLGVMLPTTPLHHLLLAKLGPVVCTSGNLHGNPIVIDDEDARGRLGEIADTFLCHDRPIARRADDGIVHVVGGRARVLRLGRGLGPVSLPLPRRGPPRLCVGGHLKNAPAICLAERTVLWPHVGDLDGPRAREAFAQAIDDLRRFVETDPVEVVCDRHPDYASSAWAEESGLAVRRVPHHAAHVGACLAEHRREDALAFAWDGYGLGDDGGAWGGEVFEVTAGRVARVGHLRRFPLPGGDAAARDGRRALAGLLVEADAGAHLDDDCAPFATLARSKRFAPPTSSIGRLFDAVSALAGVRRQSSYEGQAAMELEALAESGATPYPFQVADGVLDFGPMVAPLLSTGDPGVIASRFHATLASAIVTMADQRGARTVALTGGCFQNARLAEDAMTALGERDIEVLLPERVPVGDGGLALGQAWLAGRNGCAPAPGE